MESEPTHAIPEELEAKLIAAKVWYDDCPSAHIADDRRAEWNAQGVLLLMDVVEIIESTWNYGADGLKRAGGAG